MGKRTLTLRKGRACKHSQIYNEIEEEGVVPMLKQIYLNNTGAFEHFGVGTQKDLPEIITVEVSE